jgi:hypothetical protein
MKRILILTILAVGMLPAAANYDRDFTVYGLNGYGWKDLLPTHEARLAYVYGLVDSCALWDSKDTEAYTTGQLNRGEIVYQIDQFYADAANGQIPVWSTFNYIHLKLAGATPAELAQWTATMRRIAANPTAPAPAPKKSAQPRPAQPLPAGVTTT